MAILVHCIKKSVKATVSIPIFTSIIHYNYHRFQSIKTEFARNTALRSQLGTGESPSSSSSSSSSLSKSNATNGGIDDAAIRWRKPRVVMARASRFKNGIQNVSIIQTFIGTLCKEHQEISCFTKADKFFGTAFLLFVDVFSRTFLSFFSDLTQTRPHPTAPPLSRARFFGPIYLPSRAAHCTLSLFRFRHPPLVPAPVAAVVVWARH